VTCSLILLIALFGAEIRGEKITGVSFTLSATSMETSPVWAMLAERLMVLADKGKVILQKLATAANSDEKALMAFMSERPWPAVIKVTPSLGKSLSAFKLPAKLLEEIQAQRGRWAPVLTEAFSALAEAWQFAVAVNKVLERVGQHLAVDGENAPQTAALVLDLAAAQGAALVIVSRLPGQAALVASVNALRLHDLDDSAWEHFCDWLSRARKPLAAAHQQLSQYGSTLQSALLSPLCLAMVRMRASCDQWKKEEFMSLTTSKEEGVDGDQHVSLERMECWFFWGLLACPDLVEVNDVTSGEYKVWAMLLQVKSLLQRPEQWPV